MVLAAVIVGVVIWKNNQNSDDGSDEQETVEVEDSEKEEENGEGNSEEVVDEKKVVQYDGEDPNEAGELFGVVTYAGVNDDVLMIRVNIDQYVTSGSCELSLLRDGNTIYSSTVSAVPDVATAICEGFDVPVSGLGNGKTEISIKLNADGKSGVIRGEVEI